MTLLETTLVVVLVTPLLYSIYRTFMVRKVYPYLAARDTVQRFPDKLQEYIVVYMDYIKTLNDPRLAARLRAMEEELHGVIVPSEKLFKVDCYWIPDYILRDLFHYIRIARSPDVDHQDLARKMDTTYKWILKNTPHTFRQWRKTMILRSYIP